MVLHVGAFDWESEQQKATLWHRLSPKVRVLCAVLIVMAISLTPNGRWWTWAFYGVGVMAIALCSQVNLLRLLKRVAVEFLFVGLVLLGTLFRQDGAVVWQWGWLRITSGGLLVLGSVGLKMGLSLIMLNILVLTTSVADLLHSLIALRVPPLLVAILSAMHRYINVLLNEFTSMQRAAISRNLMGNNRWQRLVIGNMMGSLFLRTYDRGDRVHQAMLSRGYTGLPALANHLGHSKVVWHESVTLTLLVVLLCLGQGI
jgi:cobalt/nickel transport system permease protein